MNAVVVLTPEQLQELVDRTIRETFASMKEAAASEGPEVLNRKQAAEVLDVTEQQISKLRKKGLPGHKIGNLWRFRRSEILAWVSKQGGKAEGK